MGSIPLDKCIITGLPLRLKWDDVDAIEYWINVKDREVFLSFTVYALYWEETDDFFKDNKLKLEGLIYNDEWLTDQRTLITIDVLKELVLQRYFPETPTEKLENMLLFLFELQGFNGELYELDQLSYYNALWKSLYFDNANELTFYFGCLKEAGYLKLQDSGSNNGSLSLIHSFQFTFSGLNKVISLKEDGQNSKNCFIAMAFDYRTLEIRKAIKKAIEETGFIPIIIDEQNIDSGRTINDEIISSLKKCKFCIADFTFHRNGVYFESGFALGQGKQVIYTCQKDEFANAHFDIKPLQHIIYDEPQELKEKLINKIEAWIK